MPNNVSTLYISPQYILEILLRSALCSPFFKLLYNFRSFCVREATTSSHSANK